MKFLPLFFLGFQALASVPAGKAMIIYCGNYNTSAQFSIPAPTDMCADSFQGQVEINALLEDRVTGNEIRGFEGSGTFRVDSAANNHASMTLDLGNGQKMHLVFAGRVRGADLYTNQVNLPFSLESATDTFTTNPTFDIEIRPEQFHCGYLGDNDGFTGSCPKH